MGCVTAMLELTVTGAISLMRILSRSASMLTVVPSPPLFRVLSTDVELELPPPPPNKPPIMSGIILPPRRCFCYRRSLRFGRRVNIHGQNGVVELQERRVMVQRLQFGNELKIDGYLNLVAGRESYRL